MSYTIEYDRQFIRSKSGITPCWCAGDNNVTTFDYKGRERRARDWSVFYNLLGVTEWDIINAVQHSLGGYGEHWRKNGKWVDDAGLIRWIKNGCKNAASIEDILVVNGYRRVPVKLSVWTKDLECTVELDEFIATTEEFDAWIVKAKARMDEVRAAGGSAYPIVEFWRDVIRHPKPATADHPDWVLFKYSKSYLKEVTENSSTWVGNIKEAAVYSYEDAMALKERNPHGWIGNAKLVNADAQNEPYDAVLKFIDGNRAGHYVAKAVKGHLRLAYSPDSALHYRNRKAAETAMKKLQDRYGHAGTLAVEIHTKE